MAAQDLDSLTLVNPDSNQEEEFSIPLNISDIITICREFNELGTKIQKQVENILEFGVKESIHTGLVKQKSLPYIKNFLNSISKNAYFGDAVTQAEECIHLISEYESTLVNLDLN